MVGALTLLAVLLVVIIFYAITVSNYPNTIPLQAGDFRNIQALENEVDSGPITIKYVNGTYKVPGRELVANFKITNNGKEPLRIGEFGTAGLRFLNPDVFTSKVEYPDYLLADRGLSLSDNAPIAPGETRDVAVTVQPDGQMMLSAPQPFVLFPGSFNPMHAGHVLLARAAEELRQQPVAFEISVTNVDKPPLAGDTVRHRLLQFAWKSPVELTRAPTFVEKSRLFPGATFVIGADTAERLFGAKYYGDDEVRMHTALDEIASSGGSFLVAVRIDAAGRVRALNDIPVPRRYADLFTEIPEHRFRFDTSSSEIRARIAR